MPERNMYMLWLDDVDPAILATLPVFTRYAVTSSTISLSPSPLVETNQCYYQTLTGMNAGKWGRFDAVHPVAYHACSAPGKPEGIYGRLLPDILRSSGIATATFETTCEQLCTCAIDISVNYALLHVKDAGSVSLEELNSALEGMFGFVEQALPSVHIILLTGVWHMPPKAFVNVNTFLADIGLLKVQTSSEADTERHIVWSETLAYGLGSGQVWVNLQGREPDGIVGVGQEYEDVCMALVEQLSASWLDPLTQTPVVRAARRKHEVYQGDYLFLAPDLITEYAPGYLPSSQATLLKLDEQSVWRTSEQEERAGSSPHKPYARLWAWGPDIVSGQTLEAELIDVVPTLLYLFDIPLTTAFDGTVLSALFSETYMQRHAIRYVNERESLLTNSEEEIVMGRLRDLGYLG
ncbi:MAG TPA: hypothetical protein VL461_13140 [Dictyobacter sp.]|nr:hypothetical protein [Dictyobacter sp.]